MAQQDTPSQAAIKRLQQQGQSGVNLLGSTSIQGSQARERGEYAKSWGESLADSQAAGALPGALESAARQATGAGEPDAFVDAWRQPVTDTREAIVVQGGPAPAPGGPIGADGITVSGGPARAPIGEGGIVVSGGPAPAPGAAVGQAMPEAIQGSAADRANSYEVAWNEADPQQLAAAERMAARASANGGPGGLAIAARDGALNGPGSMSGAMEQASGAQGGGPVAGAGTVAGGASGLAERARQFPGGYRSNGPTA